MHMGFKEWFLISPYVISVLILFSVLVVTYFLERMWVFRREGKFPRKEWNRVTELIRERRARDAMFEQQRLNIDPIQCCVLERLRRAPKRLQSLDIILGA